MSARNHYILDLGMERLRESYRRGDLTPQKLVESIISAADALEHYNIFIKPPSLCWIQPFIDCLKQKDLDTHPLWGIPFSIKDNIDLAGVPTTGGCPDFAYLPKKSAFAVQLLIDAGAIPIGKTNLDQFATGLNGTRSPYGVCHNSFEFDLISGGSSSGSAVAVAMGLSTFSLGTDTAGSGRIPACLNNLIGLKPSLGLISCSGVIDACRSLDCISVFTNSCDDANEVLDVAIRFDSEYSNSRELPYFNATRNYGLADTKLTIGVIKKEQLRFFDNREYFKAYTQTLEVMIDRGFTLKEIDFRPFEEVGDLLYQGPWISERYITTEQIINHNPQSMYPVVREIIEPGGELLATDLFKAQYRLRELKIICERLMSDLDCLMTPTVGCYFTIKEMLDEPIKANTKLGYYSNFVNLLDFASVVVPTRLIQGARDNFLPFSISLVGPCMSDRWLLSIANRVQSIFSLPAGNTDYIRNNRENKLVSNPKSVDILVCGAHLSGLPLNWQLIERGATLKQVIDTAPIYRMYVIAGGPPLRPGLVRDEKKGAAIAAEVWSLPAENFGSFVENIPSPLGIGKVVLSNGLTVSGFICEPMGLEGAIEITSFGGWRAWLQQS